MQCQVISLLRVLLYNLCFKPKGETLIAFAVVVVAAARVIYLYSRSFGFVKLSERFKVSIASLRDRNFTFLPTDCLPYRMRLLAVVTQSIIV